MKTSSRSATITEEHLEEAARLRALWNEKKGNYTQATFGEKFDVGSQSAVGFFLNGKSALSLKAATGFAKGLGCRIADFSPRLARLAEAIVVLSSNIEPAEFVPLDRVVISIHNDRGRLALIDGRLSSLSFGREYLRMIGVNPRHAVIVQATGRSNEPTIDDGAILLVNRASQEIVNGRFYAFRVAKELLVKRLSQRKDESLLAVSDNPDREEYPDLVIKKGARDFEMIGRVIWKASEL